MYTQTLQENWKMREAGGDWLEAKVPGTVYYGSSAKWKNGGSLLEGQ